MRAVPAVLLGFLALLGLLGLSADCAASADAFGARVLLVRCAKTADARFRGLEALGEVCPGVEQAFDQLNIASLLPPNWRTELSPGALADFVALDVRYSDPAMAASVRPDAHRLRTIALNLRPPPVDASWWDRLRAWIRHWLEHTGERHASWLRFLPTLRLGSTMLRVVFIAVVVLVAAAAAAVAALEIRAMGSGAGRRGPLLGRRSTRLAASSVEGSPGTVTLADLDAAPARERPVILLRMLVQALMRAHRLRHDRDLTCRELIAEARFETARQRADFEHVALLAEQALYGPRGAPPVISEDVLRGARALHAELLAAPTAVAEAR